MDPIKISTDLESKATPFLTKIVNYGKDYTDKTLDFTTKQIAMGSSFLNTEEEVNIHASAKRSILIAYDETDKEMKTLFLLMPIWAPKAWMDNAELKYISIRENRELARTIGIEGPIEMRVSYYGELHLKTNSLAEIKAWWKKRTYKNEELPQTEVPIIDPLAGK
ncbi:hypothetical protein KBD33_01820 [Candidatus Gracilibacteria bacterium]|nr:hypothetical protein [Candidatus Gracilibacteria bacterium]